MAKNKKKKAAPKKLPWYKTKGFIGGVVAAVVVLIVVIAILAGGKNKVGDYTAEIVIRDYGTITVELDGSAAPITVKNFVGLAQSGFYEGLTFHRIIEGFMMQGGDPAGDGSGAGSTAETIYGEFAANGYDNPISHTRGTISMARRGNDMNSASSQFFIVHTDMHRSSLDGQYAAFGRVVDGMEVVDAVCESAQPTDSNGTIPPENQPIIEKITITEK
jgi:peptidyl-prolyl cis-trans isomerase B (cyclophilin B)